MSTPATNPTASAANRARRCQDVPAANRARRCQDVPAANRARRCQDAPVANRERRRQSVPAANCERRRQGVPAAAARPALGAARGGSAITRLPVALLAALAMALCPSAALAGESAEGGSATVPSTTTPLPPPSPASPSPSNTPTVTSESTSSAPAPTTSPQVQAQAPQAPSAPPRVHAKAHRRPAPEGEPAAGGTTTPPPTVAGNGKAIHAPSSFAPPPPPSALGGAPSGGVPEFFIGSFPLPPFLLPIYQAAGRAYGIPWQVLAGINEVETDFGRDLSVSSAGAEGWMQFLPSSWAMYGVDASGDGYADPYNPADAIFAAARYLRAAGGARNIRGAIFAYNHSQSYVASVMLRAQLLRGTPPQLLSAVADLAEARFPVHAPAHYADGFPALAGHPGRSLVATAIYSAPGAPVIAVQDGTIIAIGRSTRLGRYVKLRDVYGDVYTYGDLGSVASLYPVLSPRAAAAARGHVRSLSVSLRSRNGGEEGVPPASAGVQQHSPLSAGAISSGLALGAADALETTTPVPAIPTPLLRSRAHRPHGAPRVPLVFRAGREEVSLHALQVGSHVIAGTVIGHMGAAVVEEAPTVVPAAGPGAASGSAPSPAAAPTPGAAPVPATPSGPQARMIFQIRPAGLGAPLIDPKPILDSWVDLQGSLLFRATGKHRFPAAPSLVGAGKRTPKGAARLAAVLTPALTPGQWLALMTRLGSIPDPIIAGGHSAASIPLANGHH